MEYEEEDNYFTARIDSLNHKHQMIENSLKSIVFDQREMRSTLSKGQSKLSMQLIENDYLAKNANSQIALLW
jgi:hypothetical protein